MSGTNGNGDLAFARELFQAADKLRGNLEPSEYKHVALGLVFLKFVSDAFEAQRYKILGEYGDPDDRDEYLADTVFWVPEAARWAALQAAAKRPDIGQRIDAAMDAIEADNPNLKGVLPKDYGRPTLNQTMLGELIDLFSNVGMHEDGERARDLLGRVYEYFLSGFAGAEGRRGGEFFTPRSVVRVLVEMLEPFEGRIYDPCCGSGGMFVQADDFVNELPAELINGGGVVYTDRGGRRGRNLAVYGQEINHTTWRLAKMNLAVQGIDADIRWNNEGSFHRDEFPDVRADFILANPPFNISDWGSARLAEDVRWRFGAPPAGNANFAWLQHILHHLAPRGTAGVVLANGSMSSQQSGEGEIRARMVEADVVDCMVALPGQLFFSTQIPACLWILAKDKSANGHRDRRGEVLFIDARPLGRMIDRVRRELTDEDVARIAGAYHRWRDKPEKGTGAYADEPGFCRSVTLDEIAEHGHVLTPGRYVGAAEAEDDGVPFEEHFAELRERLTEQFAEGQALEVQVNRLIGGIRYD